MRLVTRAPPEPAKPPPHHPKAENTHATNRSTLVPPGAMAHVSGTMSMPWGKTADGQSHHLAHHCADVAACFEALSAIPVVRHRIEAAANRPLHETTLTRLVALSFLHDAGKLHPGFQAKGWDKGVWRAALHGHVAEGWALFADRRCGKLAAPFPLDVMAGWGEGEAVPNLLRASIGHHGRPFDVDAQATRDWGGWCGNGYDPVAAASEYARLLQQWFPAAFVSGGQPLPDAPLLQHLFRGLVTLADWIGSSRQIFPFVSNLQPDYFTREARPRARKAMATLGLDTAAWRQAMADTADFACIVPGWAPRAMQRLVGSQPVEARLHILEAETGSGKTEAALWHFARLFQAGKVDGLYFALPTRAAARQLHQRVNQVLQQLFGATAPEAILAVPGYVQAGTAVGHRLPDFKVWWEDQPDEKQMLARWAGESAKRYLAAMASVGTIDQAMLAALQVKHAHLRAAALSRSLLVVDEVHASDRYMTEIQTHLLDTHLGWGGHALLMSATLGATARSRWLGGAQAACPAFDAAVATPYPALWARGHAGPLTPAAADEREKVVQMARAADWEAETAASAAVQVAASGGRVLVIRNTVADALETFAAVRALGGAHWLLQVAGRPTLHHSRFAVEDRGLLDHAAEAALSPQRDGDGGQIVIGTQTLEQSLDIDADYLITDLCPVDVLLQRIGRLHRHVGTPRPSGFAQACCLVLAPADGLDDLAAPKFARGLGGWLGRTSRSIEGIYTNLPACVLTLGLIAEHPAWRIPAMNRLLVESATHDERIEAMVAGKGPLWQAYWNDIHGRNVAERSQAKLLTLNTACPLLGPDGEEEQFPTAEEAAIRTRLGAEGARIELPDGTIGPFGAPVSALVLPAHWSKGVDPDSTALEQTDTGLKITLNNQVLIYDHLGLQRSPVG